MTDQSQSTPRSASESNAPKFSAPKDKNCPFCHQAFTSSSLGRHLDLYIKNKNPKPPDGIHDVDEIRRIRGGITRRQARTAAQKKADAQAQAQAQTPISSKPPMSDSGSPLIMHSPAVDLNGIAGQKVRSRFNQMGWESTGVINNLPPRQNIASMPEMRREVSRHEQQKSNFEKRQQLSEEWEHLKAAELALKEVLSSVREISSRSPSLGLFDFDPYTMNFPSLCLNILPAPPTLFSPTPFPTAESWSINPPGGKQYDALNRVVRDKLVAHQRQKQQAQLNTPTSAGSGSSTSPLPTPPLYEADPQKLFAHINDAFQHWKGLAENQRREAWQLEILRSYIRAEEGRKEAENSLESARREIEHLKTSRWINMGMGNPNSCGLVSSLHLPLDTVKELGKHGIDIRSWDFDRLIEKWKNVVRENRRAVNGMSAQRSLSTSAVQQLNTTNSNGGQIPATHGLPSNSATVNGNMNYLSQSAAISVPGFTLSSAAQDSSMDEDTNDQADGEGDSEDADAEEAPEDPSVPQQPPPQMWGPPPTNRQPHPQHPHNQPQHSQHHLNPNMAQHLGSQPSSRRTSQVMMEQNMMDGKLNPAGGPGAGPGGMMSMDGMEGPNQGFLDNRMAMGLALPDSFVGLESGVTQGD